MHNIFLNSNINKNAIKICQTLINSGHEAYLVGGCVRDLIMGLIPKDWDITTNAKPEKIISLFTKTYPTGIKHGTITVNEQEEYFEITTFRIEGKYVDGRRPEEVFFVSNINEDLARRDLTINAIAIDPINNKLIDPFGGINDLNKKIIKAVGDPNLRFKEDGLRIMRAIRFAARFNYKIDEKTFKSIQNNLETLKLVSKERIKDELCKILMNESDTYGIRLLLESKIIETIFPILAENPIVYLRKCDGDLETKIAYLYYCTELNKVKQELLNLKFSTKEIKRIIFQLELIDKYNYFLNNDNSLSYKKFIAYIKNNTPDTWEYSLDQFVKLCNALDIVITDYLSKYNNEIVFSRNEMNINGDDLISIGIPRGPEIKKVLDKCYQEILNNPKNNSKSTLLKYILRGCLNE